MASGGHSIESIAIHEAGHCVAFIEFGWGVTKVTLSVQPAHVDDKDGSPVHTGQAHPVKHPETHQRLEGDPVVRSQQISLLEREIVARLAGLAAEGIDWRQFSSSSPDIVGAVRAAEKLVIDDEPLDAVLDRGFEMAKDLLAGNADLHTTITDQLIAERKQRPNGQIAVSPVPPEVGPGADGGATRVAPTSVPEGS